MIAKSVWIVGERVRLRPATPGDAPLIDALGRATVRPSAIEAGNVAVISSVGDDEPMGIIRYRIQDHRAAIDLVALSEGSRRRGLGVDAVLLFEEEARRRWGVRQFQTEVPVRNGLALYFWLRLGYRPAEPKRSEGDAAIAMIRDVEAP